eukprot:jgi/Bigna1/88612/estExt_fgenesh1_pg.C_350013
MKNSEGLINRHQNYHDGKNGETHNTPHPRTVHRPEYQTYPLRKSVEANGNVYGPGSSQKNKPSKFMTNAEARPSWSIMDELNFVTRTPIYKPALSDESAIRLDDESHPFSMPLMLGEAASPAAENNGGGMLVDKIDFPRKKLSNSEAVYTIVNIFVGLGMLSKPYSLAMGGWVSLGGLTLLCFWGAASGLIMIRCFQLVPGSRVTYPQLGEAAMGMAGRRLVQAIILLEFMGATIIVMIFMWKNFSFLFPSIPSHLVAICLTIAAAPSVWLLNFGELSFISLLGVVSNAAIMLALVGLLISEPEQIQPEKYDTYTSMEGLSISMGIYTVALAGHAALPSVYADIEDKSSIFWVVSLSFVIMWFIYCATAAAGYLFHGRGAHVLVTEDIMITNPGRVFEIVTLMVLAKSYCSVSPIVSILNEIPEAGLDDGDIDDDDDDDDDVNHNNHVGNYNAVGTENVSHCVFTGFVGLRLCMPRASRAGRSPYRISVYDDVIVHSSAAIPRLTLIQNARPNTAHWAGKSSSGSHLACKEIHEMGQSLLLVLGRYGLHRWSCFYIRGLPGTILRSISCCCWIASLID